jgi:protein-S-isoprenylcysteine O-methyltransferase Ste14
MVAELQFRLIFMAVFVTSVSISAYYRRKAQESGETISRRAEGTLALTLRACGASVVLASFLLYAFIPQWMRWSALPLPGWVRWLGAGMGIACLPLLWWVFRSIGENISETVLIKKGHRLVTDGPYRWVRHPLYGLALLELLSLSLLASNWFMMLFCLIGTLVFRLAVIPAEERKLMEAFGEGYEDYRKRTGALVPRVRI